MRAEYVNPFIGECLKIFKEMAGLDLSLNQAFRKNPLSPSRGVWVNFRILGDVEGDVSLQFSEETARKIVSSMLGGMEVEGMDELAQSAIAEIGNMITGRATIAIAENGWIADITPPKIIVDSSTIEYRDSTGENPTIGLVFSSTIQDVEMNISLKHKQ